MDKTLLPLDDFIPQNAGKSIGSKAVRAETGFKSRRKRELPIQDIKQRNSQLHHSPSKSIFHLSTFSIHFEPPALIPRNPTLPIYYYSTCLPHTTLTVSRLAPSRTTMSLRPPILLPAPSRGRLGATGSQSCPCSPPRPSGGWNPALGAAISNRTGSCVTSLN